MEVIEHPLVFRFKQFQAEAYFLINKLQNFILIELCRRFINAYYGNNWKSIGALFQKSSKQMQREILIFSINKLQDIHFYGSNWAPIGVLFQTVPSKSIVLRQHASKFHFHHHQQN